MRNLSDRVKRPGSVAPSRPTAQAATVSGGRKAAQAPRPLSTLEPEFKKKLLSNDIRAKCDLSLFLNMFKTGDIKACPDLPNPLETRAAEVVKRAGVTFENDIFERLSKRFGDLVVASPHVVDGVLLKYSDVQIEGVLLRPFRQAVIVQATFDMDGTPSELFYDAMGAGAIRPKMGVLKPDFVFVRPPLPGQTIFTRRGTREEMTSGDRRMVISIADAKHASEPNPSYEAEVVLYCVVLASWLEAKGLSERYAVDARPRLWTSGSRVDGIVDREDDDRAAALVELEEALEPVNVGVHAQELRRFVSTRMPGVFERGRRGGYAALDWHVSAACSGCEWLGNEKWLSNDQKKEMDGHEGKYCFHRALDDSHLSRIPGLTRGAVKALAKSGIDTLEKLSHLAPDHPAWSTHTSLTAARRTLPRTAEALRNDAASAEEERVDGILPRFADLTLNLFVEFDAGSGIVAGIGMTSSLSSLKDGSRRNETASASFLTDRKTQESEGQMVMAFLARLGEVLRRTTATATPQYGPPTASILFWRRSHYDELCDAIGRHMTPVLNLGDDALSALAWLFPSSSLQGRQALLRHPTVSFLADSVRRLVHTPTPHALTLADVASRYNRTGEDRRLPHPFYVDPFSDKIPRERIYEIWEMQDADTKDLRVQLTYDNGMPVLDGAGLNVMRIRTVTRDEFKEMFGSALLQRAGFIASIGQRLRRDMGHRLLAQAAPIDLRPPTWNPSVAFDARLWIARAEFAFAHDQQRTLLRYMSEPEEVEASNEGLRLERLAAVEPDGTLEFDVAQGALASKVKAPDDNVVLVPEGIPGMAAMTAATLLKARKVEVDEDLQAAIRAPLHSVFAARLLSFDRSSGKARLTLSGSPTSKQGRVRKLVLGALGLDGITGNACVFPSLPPDTTVARLRDTLEEVGNPPIALPDPASVVALGGKDAPRPGASRITPIARVLWEADALARTEVATPDEVASVVATSASRNLDASQTAAVAACAARALSIVWGPPGTGKTNTLTGFLHGLAALHGRRGTARTILVTGPTYKAVGELAQRLVTTLSGDPSFQATIALVGAREMVRIGTVPNHLDVVVTEANEARKPFRDLVDRIYSRQGVTIVCAITHQCARMAAKASKCHPRPDARLVLAMFDTIVVDESSQVDMTTAAFPLALLREGGQAIVAGDHLQMPPVQTVDAPKGAEHMVGSIQAYLIERFKIRPVALAVNYRSNAEIVSYCRGLGYPRELRAAFPDTRLAPFSRNRSPAARRQIHEALANKLASVGLPWSPAFEAVLDPARGLCAMTYPDGISGQTNAFEASIVASMALALRATMSRGLSGYRAGSEDDGVWDERDFFARGLGVVTPHRAQKAGVVAALRKAFPNADPALVEDAVDTVERFQGGERHTVIVSFGVGDPDVIQGEERFLLGLERTNVAVSRAMAKCVVLMSDEMAAHIPVDRKASAGAHAIRGIVDDWCLSTLIAPTVGGSEPGRPVTARWHEGPVD